MSVDRISVRAGGEKSWQFLDSEPYDAEAELRDLIFGEPLLIPTDEIGLDSRIGAVAATELSLRGAGLTDVLIVYENGQLAVVETKLATNSEKKRAVIGQVLDYASALAELSFEDLDGLIRNRRNADLVTLMRDAAIDETWSQDEFADLVTSHLKEGAFRLIVAIDEMDADLARLIAYLSHQSKGTVNIFGLELHRYTGKDFEAMVPRISNPVSAAQQLNRERNTTAWNRQSLREAFPKLAGEDLAPVLDDLLEFTIAHSPRVYFGSSSNYGSLGCGFKGDDGVVFSLFTAYTTGELSINRHPLLAKVSEAAANDFLTKLSLLHGFEELPNRESDYPQFRVMATLGDTEIRDQFKQAILDLSTRSKDLE